MQKKLIEQIRIKAIQATSVFHTNYTPVKKKEENNTKLDLQNLTKLFNK